MRNFILTSVCVFIIQIGFAQNRNHFELSDTVFEVFSTYNAGCVNYDLDGKNLPLPQSFPCLDSVADFILQHPGIILEVGCYTDQRGSDSSNIKISQSRANNTKAYLVSRGVPEWSLAAVGYGEKFPLWTQEQINAKPLNEDREKMYQLNRRTEFRILRTPKITFTLQDTAFVMGAYLFYPMKYALGKGTIDSCCYPFLDSLAAFLIAHPELLIKVSVHVDTRYSDKSSYKIAQDRAQHVVDYLVKKGVPYQHLIAYGCNATEPIVPDKITYSAPGKQGQEELHAINRRTEIRITGFNPIPGK